MGRAVELDRLLRGLGEAQAGQGRLRFVVGEPGIGKTRLCDELAAAAAGRRVPVSWGRCWESGGAPPFWPWLECLGTLARDREPARLAEELGGGAGVLARLVPEIAERLPAVKPAGPLESEEARFHLFRAVAGFLRRAAAPGALVLVLDDLHAADMATLALLRFVARELRTARLLVLGTYRDVEARMVPVVGEALARIAREGEVIALRRLDAGEAAALVRALAGASHPEAEAAIFEATQGNPLFVDEVVRVLLAGSGLERAAGAGPLPIPFGVREAIRQHLGHLSPAARGVLDAAAVLGSEIKPGLVAAVTATPLAAVTDLLAEAQGLDLVVERGASRLAFSHALVREVIYRDLPRAHRLALHGAAARAIERLHEGDARAPLAEIAHHYLEAAPEDVELAVAASIGAAERSMGLHAFQEAIGLLERARAAVELLPNPERWRGELLVALGQAKIRSGESAHGKELCLHAAELARRMKDGHLLAAAALALGAEIAAGVVDRHLVGLLEEARAALGEEETSLKARVLARLAAALQPAPDPRAPIVLAREAIALARRLGDKPTLMAVLFSAVSAMVDFARPRELIPLNLELEQLAEELGDPVKAMRARARLVMESLEAGDVAAADAFIERYERQAAELRLPHYEWRAPLFRAMRAIMVGQFALGERLLAEGEALARRTTAVDVELCLFQQRLGLMRTWEHWPDAERIAQSLPSAVGPPEVTSYMALFQVAQQARAGRAEGAAEVLAQSSQTQWSLDRSFAATLAEVAVAAGDRAAMAKLYEGCLVMRDEHVTWGLTGMIWDGPWSRYLGLLAAGLGRRDEAAAHFEDALRRCEAVGARPFLARVAHEYADTLAGRGSPGDAEKARELRERAGAIAEELQMTGLAAVLRERLDGAPSRPAPPGMPALAAPAGFGLAREGEYWAVSGGGAVVRLKDSRGMQILARLVSTPDTEVHVLDLMSASADAEGGAADAGDAGELIDAEAKDAYRRRLEDLREEIAEAEAFGDQRRAGRARAETEAIAGELARAVGLGGRQRRAGAAAERARVAVQRRLRDAIRRIEEHDPALGRYLDWAVRTGTFCTYRTR